MKTLLKYILSYAIMQLFIGCAESSDGLFDNNQASEGGKGGSLARFAINGNVLYTVDSHNLKYFDISEPEKPAFKQNIVLDLGVETIFIYQGYIYIGSQFGMYIYKITDAGLPVFASNYSHITTCDPVVVDGNYAFVTLRSEGGRCGNFVNEMHVIDITDKYRPQQVDVYQMKNPRGLGIVGGKLYVCDNGLKLYDATDPLDLKELKYYTNLVGMDIIPYGNRLIVLAEDGIYQYERVGDELELLSKIPMVLSKKAI